MTEIEYLRQTLKTIVSLKPEENHTEKQVRELAVLMYAVASSAIMTAPKFAATE